MTITLKTIKSKTGNAKYSKLLAEIIKLIKNKCEITPNKTMYFLGYFDYKHIFLCDGIVYFAYVEVENVELKELYQIKLLKEYPETILDIDFKVILGKENFTPELFLDWIDMPSCIIETMDIRYYELITFLDYYLNNSKKMFSTERYDFNPCLADNSSYIFNVLMFDKKTNKKLRLYVPAKWEKVEDDWHQVIPTSVRDVVVDDLSGELSTYQKRQYKKAFLKLANKTNYYWGEKIFWVMELIKQTTKPIDKLHEWSCHRIFAGLDKENKPKRFTNIWVHDFPSKKEEPCFFITNSPYLRDTTKIAVLNFKSSTYHLDNYKQGIYKRSGIKTKLWKLNENEIKELMEFLRSPNNRFDVGEGRIYDGYKKYVKTNWQQLIFEYNHNSAGWGWGDGGFNIPPEKDTDRDSDIEALPFDLPIPDYTKLTLNEVEEELGSWTKEMLKPENLAGSFETIEELMEWLESDDED